MQFERSSRASRTSAEERASNPAWLVGPATESFTPRSPGTFSLIRSDDAPLPHPAPAAGGSGDPGGV